MSIEKTKEVIAMRQNKAVFNKNHNILEKSKRVEGDLSRWEKVVERNKKLQDKKLEESLRVIDKWNS